MASLLFYEKPVALNKVAHKDMKIAPLGGDYSFAAKTNSVILAGIEFAEAAKEYPIVFTKTANDKYIPVALLGLRNEENLFVGEEGKWDSRYIPAFVRRYPFVLADAGNDADLTVCVDEAYAGLNTEDGQGLFAEDGEYTPLLQQAVDFLGEYQRQYKRTEMFLDKLGEMGLFTELTAKVNMVDGRQFALGGLQIVDERKLLGLDDSEAAKLFKTGELAWVYAHLISLSNMGRLVDRLPADAAEAAEEVVDEGKKKKKA